MKVLWITFAPIGRASTLFYHRPTQSGGWVDASLRAIAPELQNGNVELTILSLGEENRLENDPETGVAYQMIQMPRLRGKRYSAKDAAKWHSVLQEIRPDLIQIWGTEFSFGLDVLDAAGDIPVCFFIQGVMASLAAHPLGDIPARELFRQLGLSSYPKLRSLKKWHKINKRHVAIEGEMIRRSSGVLADNEWSQAQYFPYTDKFYTVPLAANPCFLQHSWSADTCNKHTLFCVAGGICPQKGVHNAVLAVAALKERYPDIRLNIPGNISSRKPAFLYDSVYIRHLRKIIKEYGLEKNICFVGSLTQEQMAQQMASANVFVMPSCVETHSSTLREAMTVGTPCISAMVGSVAEFLEHGKEGYLYRYDEPETLAYYIHKLFSDNALAAKLGQAGQHAVKTRFPQSQMGTGLLSAYQKMTAK